jgi:hypothetical protein
MLSVAIVLAVIALTARGNDIETLQAVGDHAEGAAAARAARDALVEGGSENLLPVLEAFQGSSPLAINWLRNTFESIADAELKAGRSLPKEQFIQFINTTSESPAARRLAYEWLRKRHPEVEQQLIPKMLLDPSPEFRRDAVAKLLSEATQKSGQAAIEIYKQALRGAVHKDQVKTIATALREAGVEADLQKHFGFLATWKVIGPFDNRQMKGFPIAYPPEQSIDFSDEYEGQLGPVRWQPISSDDDYGVVDIGKQIENYKGSVMYATTTFHSDRDQQVEFRLGTPNAWKLWVNGEMVFQREEYHRGTRMDQYKVPVTLNSGPNTILLKICQNEQTQSWAQDYLFQLRVCDSTGVAIAPKATSADLSAAGTGSGDADHVRIGSSTRGVK